MADVASDLKTWSTTASSNNPSGSTAVGAGLDDNLREIQKVVRQDLASKGSDVASTATADVGAVAGFMHDITGTTTITSLGTVAAGIHKVLKFEGALTLTHNATSLILPGGANITTADGDIGWFISEGSGNWRCISYFPAAGTGTGGLVKATSPTIATPTFTGTTTAAAIASSSSVLSSGATNGIGYTTGAGGTVTQATNKSTGVTLSKMAGEITMSAANLAAGTSVTFTLTNTGIAASDYVHVQHNSAGTLGSYSVYAIAAAGSANITVKNTSAGDLAEAIVLKFLVIKAATS